MLPNTKKCIANIYVIVYKNVDKVSLLDASVNCFCRLKNASNEVKLLQKKVTLVGPGLLQCYVA